MKLDARQRWVLLLSLLVLTSGAGYLLEEEPDVPRIPIGSRVTKPEARAIKEHSTPNLTEVFAKSYERQPPPDTLEVDPFRVKSWYVAPPPPPPPKPTAPTLPYQYLGRLVEGDVIKVFVSRQGKHLVVQEGDLLDSTYSVVEVSSGQVVFEYLPLKEKQILSIGGR